MYTSSLPVDDIHLVNTNYGPIWVAKNDKFIGLQLAKQGHFEEHKISEVVSFIQKQYGVRPYRFIDIGANIGTHIIYALKKSVFNEAIGFEPDPFNYSILKLNLENNHLSDKSKIYNLAISDNTGVSDLSLSNENFGDHRIKIENQQNNSSSIQEEERKLIRVKTDTLNSFISNNNIQLDLNTLIWIDTQGHEGHVVSGFKDMPLSSQPFVVLEFWPYGLEISGGKDRFMDFLRNCRYVFDIRDAQWNSTPIALTEEQIEEIYKKFLSETTADHYPHTDFLCIPKSTKFNKVKKIKLLNLPIILKNKYKRFKLRFQESFNINRINVQQFEKDSTLHVKENNHASVLQSELCRFERLNSSEFRAWLKNLNYAWAPHRKYWELAFICQALYERNILVEGAKGLGFAVGTERLPAFFASLGCNITATDLPSEDERNKPWAETGQWGGTTKALQYPSICNEEKFNQHVRYLPVDMNNIPDDLVDYDFTWSTCSFEHCGSIELGMKFIEEQMKCLKPGGIAVHTTEFNLTSNGETFETPLLSIFRLKDIEEICNRLIQKGYQVEPLDTFTGTHKLDKYVDKPPYATLDSYDPSKVKHLRLTLDSFVSTSIALIIKK
jgi:FkbM family methyltransferase